MLRVSLSTHISDMTCLVDLPLEYGFIYPLCIAIGFVLLLVVNVLRRKAFGLSLWLSILISVFVEAFSILGASLLYQIENPATFYSYGFSFFGVIFFLPVFLSLLYIFLRKKISYSNLFSYVAVAIPLELAVIRVACALNGCCYGIESSWGIHYGVYTRFPVQPLEAILDLGIFVLLLLNERRRLIPGNQYVNLLVLYGVVRFACEFVRGDGSALIFTFTNGQVYSLVCIVLGIGYYLFLAFKEKKTA